jgi:hypothetical protein
MLVSYFTLSVCSIPENFQFDSLQEDSPFADVDEEENFIPDEMIMEFKSRGNIKQQREELRQQLLNNFKKLCNKTQNIVV